MSMPPYGGKPGRRKAGPHRCSSVRHALGWTLLSALVPGAGFLHNRRQRLGALLLLVSAVGAAWVALAAPHNLNAAITLATDPARLTRAAIVTSGCLAVWVAVVVGTFLTLRPRPEPRRWLLMGGGALVGALCLAVVAPVTLVVRDAFAQADVVNKVFTHNQPATAPEHRTAKDPWDGRDRPAPQPDGRAVPGRKSAPRGVPERLHRPRRPRQLDAQRDLPRDPDPASPHPRQVRRRGGRRDQAGRGRGDGHPGRLLRAG